MRDYGNAILDCLSARGVWEPGESIRPGDYGQIIESCFVRLGSVADVGVRLGQPQVSTEGPYEISRGFEAQQQVSATANVEWTGEAISAIHWKGGAGLFLGSPKSQLWTIADLGQVVRETLQRKGWWKFNWRLVRQVRTVDNGVIALGGNSASSGRISLSAKAPLHDGSAVAAVQRSDGFSLLKQGINGAVYAQVVRLKPFLMHGAAPLEHSLWYEDLLDDEDNIDHNEQDMKAALAALTADVRLAHRACIRLVDRLNHDLASNIIRSHSAYFENAGRDDDPAVASYLLLLKRLGPIADGMPSITVASMPISTLWAATGPVGQNWLVVVPSGVVSFFREFCTVVFNAREIHKQSPTLDTSIKTMSALLGAHLELGSVDFSGIQQLSQHNKPIIEHLTQLAYEFFLLHESYHVRESHQEPDPRATTWYQDAHIRHSNEFDADRWAFQTLLVSFSNDLHLVTVAVAMLFDALELLDRFDFAPMARLTHPSPATRKWRLMRLLEPPDALHFLDQNGLLEARSFSLLYERLAAWIVDRAKPATPLNDFLNWGADVPPQSFVEAMLPMMACGDPNKIVENLARIRRSSLDWAAEGREPDDFNFVTQINERIDFLAHQLSAERGIRRYAHALAGREEN